MSERYYHLAAEVNGQLKDVLMHEEVLNQEGTKERDFFASVDGRVINNGLVEIIGGSGLPDIIG